VYKLTPDFKTKISPSIYSIWVLPVPKARGQYSHNWGKLDSLLIGDDSHYLFCYTCDRNGDRINLIICVVLQYFIYTTATITNLHLPISSRDVVMLGGLIKFLYCIKYYLAIKSANELFLN